MLSVTAVDPSGVQRGRLVPLACSAVLRDTAVGTWTATVQPDGLGSRIGDGWSVVISDDTGQVCAGPLTSHSMSVDNGFLARTISGVTDFHILADRITYPSPALNAASQADGYYRATGPAQTVIRDLVDKNAGPSALSSRRTPRFELPPSLGRGAQVKVEARFKPLADVVLELARAGGISVSVERVNQMRRLIFRTPLDRTRQVRFGGPRGGLTDGSVSLVAPDLTTAIVAGQGQGVDRTVREYENPPAYGRRIEQFKDRRDTDDEGTHAQAAAGYLDEGAASASAAFTVEEVPGLTFGVDYQLGDRVTVILGDLVATEPVREVELAWDPHGRTARLKLGDHDSQDDRAPAWVKKVQGLDARLRGIEVA